MLLNERAGPKVVNQTVTHAICYGVSSAEFTVRSLAQRIRRAYNIDVRTMREAEGAARKLPAKSTRAVLHLFTFN